MNPFRLILIDDDLRRRAAISHCLAGNGIHVEPYETALEAALRWPEDGILLAHDSGDTIETIVSHMSRNGSWLPMIAFAENPHPRQVVKAVTRGVTDYLAWPFSAAEVQEAVSDAEQRTEAQASTMLREAMARSRVQKLTRRELEVLTAVAEGRSNRAIAEKLHISPRTVEIHRANMLSKLNANHTSEAIRIAIEASLVS